ncbi:MAG: cupin domain-containing protein [Spirochaetaceae bacterium]|jgi:mannose-6-phosphate isomerase-like protein (cupin superfamily)|nr:cupin domain-containing protein [Spirochaetaceae bacterium]GMO22763.1 MAG: hypothetical protein Pg6A_10020 [Termitinemataceae bacterium]
MVIKRKQMPVAQMDKMLGGNGVSRLVELAPKEVMRNLRVLKEITLDPGVSIGNHDHKNETEYFLITQGSGVVNDNGSEIAVHSGDVVVTGNGSFHSLVNTGKRKLVFYAIIVTY